MKYDPDNGACFNTFFWTCANRRFLDLHKAASRKMRVGDYSRVSLEAESVRAAVNEWLVAATWQNSIADFPSLSVGVTYLPIPIGGAILFLFVFERLTIGPVPSPARPEHAAAAFE